MRNEPSRPEVAAAVPCAGWHYVVRVEVTRVDARGRLDAEAAFVGRVTARGERAHVEVLEDAGEFRRGQVLLTTDGGRTLQVSTRDPSGRPMGSLTITARGSRVARMVAPEPTVRGERLPARDTVAGFATERYRLTVEHDALSRRFLLLRPARTRAVTDYWVHPALLEVPNPIGRYFRERHRARLGDSPALRARTDAMEADLVRGTALRVVTACVIRVPGGGETIELLTWELRDLAPTTLHDPLFVDPAAHRPTRR